MKSNWLILCLIFLVFGLIVFFIIKNNKDSKQKQFEIEQRAHEELRRLKNDQERVDADMAQQMADQERQLHQMRLKSQQEEESKRQIEKNKHAEEQKSFLLQEMKMRGNLPWLILVLQGQEYRYEINDPIFTIGRELSNNLNIPDSTMSRKHAVIKFKNGEYTIQDLNSSNGIIVNGQKQSEIILMLGDVIQIGQSMLTFMI
jgi:hypothetical protein